MSVCFPRWVQLYANSRSGTRIHQLRNLLAAIPLSISKLDQRYLDGRTTRFVVRSSKALEKPARWIVPVAYWVLISVCIVVFCRDTYPQIESSNLRYVLVMKSCYILVNNTQKFYNCIYNHRSICDLYIGHLHLSWPCQQKYSPTRPATISLRQYYLLSNISRLSNL